MLSVGERVAVFVLVHIGKELCHGLFIEPVAIAGYQFLHVALLVVGAVAEYDIWQFPGVAVACQGLAADSQAVHQFLCAVHPLTSQE